MISKTVIVIISSSLLLCLAALGRLYFYNQTPPVPQPQWNHSSAWVVLQIDRFRGEVDCDYMPPLQIRGNGQVLRVYYDEGIRHVLEAMLSEQEMEKLINDFIQAGFFDNDTRFDSLSTEGDYIMLSLKNSIAHEIPMVENKVVAALTEQLVYDIAGNGRVYVPPEGLLNVYQVDRELNPNVVIQAWPDEQFGYTLEEIIDEQKVLRGEELLFAWEIRNSTNRVVQSDGKFYWFCITHE